jgi:hypothetical protein
MSETVLTAAQREFLEGIKPHVDYRTIGKLMATAKRLEAAGYVVISSGYFAHITPAGRAALSSEGK